MENKSGKMYQANTGSKSNNFETNTSTKDLALVNAVFAHTQEEKVEAKDEDIKDAVVYENGATSIDFMMPEDERKILEKNLNTYGDMKKMQEVLNVAKRNKAISEDLKSLEIISKLGDFSNKIFDMLMDDRNMKVLEEYIQRKFEEGDIAKAYKEVGLLNKAMLDAREGMIQKLKTNRSGKKAKIALKFTNDSGEDYQLGAEIDV